MRSPGGKGSQVCLERPEHWGGNLACQVEPSGHREPPDLSHPGWELEVGAQGPSLGSACPLPSLHPMTGQPLCPFSG